MLLRGIRQSDGSVVEGHELGRRHGGWCPHCLLPSASETDVVWTTCGDSLITVCRQTLVECRDCGVLIEQRPLTNQ